jgi:hypothetical protein
LGRPSEAHARTAATCITCHDNENSPTFDYATYRSLGRHRRMLSLLRRR